MQRSDNSPAVASIASRCDKSKQCCDQAFASLIHAESKGLQKKKYRPNGKAIDEAVYQPVAALRKRICSGEKRHFAILLVSKKTCPRNWEVKEADHDNAFLSERSFA